MSKIYGGRYEVLEQIGAGGMAIVYKAKDLLLHRIVTIKVLREQFVSDEDFVRRFRREAQSAASLSHPNIVSVYDVGKEGDTEYIVMEYVEGRNLKEIIREFAPLSNDQTINLARQITGAIQNAHQHHIIHRDIKPHNILVTADGHAKVTDFGIARAVSSATVTHTGDIIGSVHYLSPEQAKGLASNEQSDIYALGIVLYELLTGKVPYDGETPIAIALKHLQEQPVLPSKLNPRIDKEFEAVIMRAIAKSPQQRYMSAKDLLEDLNHIQAGRPITKLEIPAAVDPEATQTHKGLGEILAPIPVQDAAKDSGEKKPLPAKQNNKKRLRWLVGGLTLIVLLALGVVIKDYISVGTTKVPNLIGMTDTAARDSIQQAQLALSANAIDYQFSNTAAKGVVVDQDPKPDATVKIGRSISIVESKGPEEGPFPDVTSTQMTKENAVYAIKNAGFTEKPIIDDSPSDTVPKGYVMAQDPAPNATWAKNGRIHLTISSGQSFHMINMPNVIGKKSAEAQSVLSGDQNNLVVQSQTEDSMSTLPDVVIRTIPNPGEPVQQGDTVTMIVSRGPGPVGMVNSNSLIGQILGSITRMGNN